MQVESSIKSSRNSIQKEDGIHDVACKIVVESAEQMVVLLNIFARQGYWQVHQQRSTGKNFLNGDFRPVHLRVIYDLFNDDMVKQYLGGDSHCETPMLIRQFASNETGLGSNIDDKGLL